MASIWEPVYGDPTEIDVVAGPSTSSDRRRLGALDQARRAARGLRALAWLIAVSSVVGHILMYWFPGDVEVWPDDGWASRFGNLLGSTSYVFALAGVIYGIATFVLLYAARIDAELDPARRELDER